MERERFHTCNTEINNNAPLRTVKETFNITESSFRFRIFKLLLCRDYQKPCKVDVFVKNEGTGTIVIINLLIRWLYEGQLNTTIWN